jgi:pimeloyl-ACP methyl ester carboxylesterase
MNQLPLMSLASPESLATKRELSFVLLHGAWHGGWCWQRVATMLRAHAHLVSTPTQTGVGERRHLLADSVDFDTFVSDICNHLLFEELRDVTLVGHSFGASVAAAVADRDHDRIGGLIFLDGFLPESDRSLMEQRAPESARERIRAAERTSGGLSMPVPAVEVFGIKSERDRQWVAAKLTPHPLRTYVSKIRLGHPLGNGLPCDYVICTNPRYPGTDWSVETARRHGWRIHELRAGHDAMIDAPAATAELLEEIALRQRLP